MLTGAAEAEEEDNKHGAGVNSPKGEAAVRAGGEPHPERQSAGGGG